MLYAAVWQAVFAVVEITGPPRERPAAGRAGRGVFRSARSPRSRDLHDAPAVEEAGIFPQSLWRHSHIRLTRGQFAAARRLIEDAA